MALIILLAALAGLFPSVIWLAFWLLEDRCEPEPKWRIGLTFFMGMIAVAFVLPIEQYVQTIATGTLLLFLWAATEELFKLFAATPFGLGSRAYDEPLDAIVYMVTAALGFSAAENALFLFSEVYKGQLAQSILVGDMRFIGATLLHTVASATIGGMMALFYYKPGWLRALALALGVILAVGLHTLFNFFILASDGSATLYVFIPIWAGVIAILALIEKVKEPTRDYC